MSARQRGVRTRAAGNRVLDSAALERLEHVARGGDPTLIPRLIAIFLEDTPDRLRRLALACEGRDDAALRDVAHTLRGGSATFGAHEMVAHCSSLEHMPLEWHAHDIQTHIDALDDAYQRTRTALLRLSGRLLHGHV